MQNTTKIYYNKKEKLDNPILIVGLPGIGSVGSLVCEHIKNEAGAKRMGVLYSSYFPHQAVIQKNGGLHLVNNRFYHFKNRKGRSILILLGDTQADAPTGQYEVNSKIVSFVRSLGCGRIYTIGGYSAGSNYIKNPRVLGVATTKKLKSELEKSGVVFGQAYGAIWGSAGLIPAFSKGQGIESACIMGETNMLEIDANAAKAVLEILRKILDIEINMDNIEKIKTETERIIRGMEEASKEEGGDQHHKENFSYIR